MFNKIKRSFDRPFHSPIFWFIFLVIRILASITMTRWNHPDEWYQTAELANLLWNKHAMYTGEIGLHMRNLSWAILLGIPIHLADLIDPQSAFLRPFLIRLFTGFLDIGILWGWIQCTINLVPKESFRSKIIRLLTFTYLGLWFLIQDSVRPSQEHMSSVFFWISLGFFAKHLSFGRKRDSFLAAFFSIGIAAMKYPAALFTLGLFLASLFFALPKFANRVRLKSYFLGLMAGLLCFGFGDFLVYGRPFESFYTYFIFNVVAGLSSQYFGSQSGMEYLNFFKGHWLTVLLPISVLVMIALCEWLYFQNGRIHSPTKTSRVWGRAHSTIVQTVFFCTLLYVIGHLLISHKEGRFIWPVESVMIWFAVLLIGSSDLLSKCWQNLIDFSKHRIAKVAFILVLLGPNFGFVLKSLWGDAFRTNSTYFEIDHWLKAYPETCAVITSRKPLAVHIPKRDGNASGGFAFGFFPSERDGNNFTLASKRPLYWLDFAPKCSDQGIVLLHLPKFESDFVEQRCTLLPSAILKWVPISYWPYFLSKPGFVSGIWMKCDPKVLDVFSLQEVVHPFATSFGYFSSLPPPSINGEALLQLGKEQKVNPDYGYLPDDGTFGKW